jgi:hypothetical protein
MAIAKKKIVTTRKKTIKKKTSSGGVIKKNATDGVGSTKMRWYHRSSVINTNKKEAQRIAEDLRLKKRYKCVRVVKRDFKEDIKTGTPMIEGWWIKISSK